MKKVILTVSVIALSFTTSILLTACGGSSEHTAKENEQTEAHQHAELYQCPMKCEGEKTYAEAGTCPTCGMNLELMEAAHDHDHHTEHEGHEHDSEDHGHQH
jgi:Cu2+-exporting ATPase